VIPVRPFIILVAVALSFSVIHIAHGADTHPKPTNRTASILERLKGTWVGVAADDVNGGEITITITIKGNSFRFHRDTNFWFETTIVLPGGTVPQQLLATIIRCAPSQGSSIGKVVPAILKIEGGTMTIGAFADIEDPTKDFQDIEAANLYTLRLVSSQELVGPAP